jgi:twinkle protein
MAYGIRSGELVLFTAQQKVGKTEVLRAIEHHLLKTTLYNIGIIHLEENERRTIQGLASYELSVPVHLPDSNVSKSDVMGAYSQLAGGDCNRVYLYSSFGSNDPDTILDRIRYLVTACNCKFIFLDHMTRLVSSNLEDDLRRTLDYLATTFAIMCKELDFTLFLVCHVNDEGQPRDSRMIAKECNLHVYFSRDKENADAAARNTVSVMVRDNRFSGSTGPAGELTFDPKTFKLTEKEKPVEVEFDGTI